MNPILYDIFFALKYFGETGIRLSGYGNNRAILAIDEEIMLDVSCAVEFDCICISIRKNDHNHNGMEVECLEDLICEFEANAELHHFVQDCLRT